MDEDAHIRPSPPLWCHPDDDASWQPESRGKRFLRVTSGHAARIREHGAMRTRSPLATARMEFDRPHPHTSPSTRPLCHSHPLMLVVDTYSTRSPDSWYMHTYTRIYRRHLTYPFCHPFNSVFRSSLSFRSFLCTLFINSTLPLWWRKFT